MDPLTFISHPTATIYTVSDLGPRYRAILDEAKRDGMARLRDADGSSMAILPESAVAEADHRLAVQGRVIESMRGVLAIESALARDDDDWIEATLDGTWPWLKTIGRENLETFVADLRAVLLPALSAGDAQPIQQLLHEWRATAEIHRDPDLLRRLRRDLSEDEFDGGEVNPPRRAEGVARQR